MYKLLIDRQPRADIEAHLRWAADENITVSVPEERLARVVSKLLALSIAASGERQA